MRWFALSVAVAENSEFAGSCLADRLALLIELTLNERDALARLEGRIRPLGRGGALLRANDRLSELFVVRRGVLMSVVLLDDGSRQILRLHYPGDILGCSALVYRHAPETLLAMTDAEVAPFDRTALATLAVDHPRLSAAVMALGQIDRTILADRLTALGRSSARARIAALLIEIRDRLRETDNTITNSFMPGLTQEEIGDAAGLTAVHVNRMLRQLEKQGMIARDNGRVTLVDERALVQLAHYTDRHAGIDLGWLPPAR